ncbi:MAG: protein kinase domain-containing protein, partial [Candidatus Xenobia bacterium]
QGDRAREVAASRALARAYLELGNQEQAVSLLQELARGNPADAGVGMELGELYVNTGRIQEAAEQLQRVAQVQMAGGQLEEAAEALRRVRVVAPEAPIGHLLGTIHHRLGNFNEAEVEYRAILRRDLSNVDVLMALGQLCQQKGQFRDAILAFNRLLKVDPQRAVAREKLGELYEAQGNLNDAIKHYTEAARQMEEPRLWQRILALDPMHPDAYRELEFLGAPLEATEEVPRARETRIMPPEGVPSLSSPTMGWGAPLAPEAWEGPAPSSAWDAVPAAKAWDAPLAPGAWEAPAPSSGWDASPAPMAWDAPPAGRSPKFPPTQPSWEAPPPPQQSWDPSPPAMPAWDAPPTASGDHEPPAPLALPAPPAPLELLAAAPPGDELALPPGTPPPPLLSESTRKLFARKDDSGKLKPKPMMGGGAEHTGLLKPRMKSSKPDLPEVSPPPDTSPLPPPPAQIPTRMRIPLPPTRAPSGHPAAAPEPVSLPSWAAADLDLPEPEAPREADPPVQFSLYRPRLVRSGQWYPLLAFAHLDELPGDMEAVRAMAMQRLGKPAIDYGSSSQDASRSIPRGSPLTFVPAMAGVEFNPPRASLLWLENLHMQEFRLRAAPGAATRRGRLTVYLDLVVIAEIPFTLRVDEQGVPASESPLARDSSRGFRTIYTSYSPLDQRVVETFRRYAGVLGDRWLPDPGVPRESLVWDGSLMRAIEQADVFQVFWSRHALGSELVSQELRHALSARGVDFIRPTCWEDPIPLAPQLGMPPPELLRTTFYRIALDLPPTPPAANAALGPGTVLQSRYRVVELLGRGGMGVVYRAEDGALGQRGVAIKEMLPHAADEAQRQQMAQLFRQEAMLLARLDHPNIVGVTDAFEVGGRCYLVMTLVRGRPLSQVSGTISDVLGWALQLCDALEYLHAQAPPIVFRDLKPSNIMLDEHGRIRLIDFGISKVLTPDGNTLTMARGAGTMGYAPPEQFAGTSDARSDLYALGATLYRLLTGQTPPPSMERIQGSADVLPPSTLNPAVGPQLERVVLALMALRADDRPQYVADVRSMVLAAGQQMGSSPVPVAGDLPTQQQI